MCVQVRPSQIHKIHTQIQTHKNTMNTHLRIQTQSYKHVKNKGLPKGKYQYICIYSLYTAFVSKPIGQFDLVSGLVKLLSLPCVPWFPGTLHPFVII